MSDTIVIQEIATDPGTKSSGLLKVADGPMFDISVPIVIINGSDNGPTLCLTSGTHGCEFPGIAAVLQVCRETNPRQLKGALIAVPIVNVRSFQNRVPYVNPIDNLNIEAIFPGKPEGSVSEVLAHRLLDEVVRKADYGIDCHGGDLDELMIQNTYFPKIGVEAIDCASEALARIYGFEYICVRNMTRIVESAKIGVPHIQTESGCVGVLSKTDTVAHYTGITNVMKYLDMIPGTPVIPIQQQLIHDQFFMKTRTGGFFVPTVELYETVSEGQTVGVIWNLQGAIIDEIVSTGNGIIRKIYTRHAVHSGDTLMVGFTSPELAPSFPSTDRFIRKPEDT
jgi:predicted deacylase